MRLVRFSILAATLRGRGSPSGLRADCNGYLLHADQRHLTRTLPCLAV